MKKVLLVCLTIALMMSMTLTAFAAPGAFISSPTGNKGPVVVEFTPSDEDCTAILNITPYGDRGKLPPALKELIEKAYDSIKNTNDPTTLTSALANLAKKLGLKGTDLAVSDLFDIYASNCEFHDGHLDFDIVLSAEGLKNFVALLHMNKDGKWELVEDAKVTGDGDHLKFSVENLSPFAIVVKTGNPAQTGDNSMIPLYIAIMAVSAVAIVAVLVIAKKKRA